MIKNVAASPLGTCAASPRTAPAIPLQVRESTFRDYPSIAALMARNGLGARSYDSWVDLWQRNPAYDERDRWPIGWILETKDGEVVGAIGNIPAIYHWNGSTIRAAIACDWAVDPVHRAWSLVLLQKLTAQPTADLCICTTVSPQSELGFKPLGWARVPAGKWDRVAFWVTHYRSFARVALGAKRVPLASALSYPLSMALFCRDRVGRAAGVKSPDPRVEIEPCADFDIRFEAFWEELRGQNKDVLIGERSRPALAWHFQRRLRERQAWLLACCRAGRMVAYAVFDRCDNPGTGLTRLRVIDMQALRGHDQALIAAFDWMLRKARQEGVAVVENLGCWLEDAGLAPSQGLYHRAQPAWCFYYKARDRKLAESLKNPEVWRASAFDGDISL